ncbi:MAG TPA: SRPBCC family protein [Thermoleophilaceae bacterium]
MAAESRLVASTVIQAPPEKVWEVVSATGRYAEWVVNTDEVVRTDNPRGGPDVTYDERNTIAGPWKASTRWRVTEFDPPHRQVHEGEGVAFAKGVRLEIDLAPAGESTEISNTAVYEPKFGPVGALLDKALRPMLERDFRRTMENLKRLVESEANVATR